MARKVLFRVAAILIAVAATFLVAEASLQLASVIVRDADRGSRIAPSEGEFRISCVGESTTFGLWPSQLEEILNEKSSGRKFRVINRGDVGIRTDAVARKIEGWLDEDRPHLVITMLGINDEGNVLVSPRDDPQGWLLKHSRTSRFLLMLGRSAANRIKFLIGGDDWLRRDGHLDEDTRTELKRLRARRPEAMKRFRYSEMIEAHRHLLVVDPGTPFYHLAFLKELVVENDPPERLDEFLVDEVAVEPTEVDVGTRLELIELWAGRTGDRFAALRLAASVACWGPDPDLERSLLEAATQDPELAGPAWLRLADFAARKQQPEAARRYLLRAGGALPDDYQWRLLLGHLAFQYESYSLAATNFQRALALRPGLPPSHEIFLLGRLANSCDQSGDTAGATGYRARRDRLELGRFREFTRFHYQRVVDSIRAREIPVIAMQYPLLSVRSLQRLLEDRTDVIYLENRVNFESALGEAKYREIFDDHFAGSFGHLRPRGNMLVAENVADTLANWMPELFMTANPAPSPEADPP